MSDNFKEEFEKNLILENIKEELEQKDQRIKVLERALRNNVTDTLKLINSEFGENDGVSEYAINRNIEKSISQAEKEILK